MPHPAANPHPGEALEREAQPGAAPAPQQVLLQMAIGKWMCQALKVAAELGVADVLAGGARGVDEVARRTGADEDSLYRLLRALAGAGVFQESRGRRFENNAVSELLRSDVPGSLRAMVRWVGEDAAWDAWRRFGYSVRTGRPAFDHAFGEPVFDYFAKHPESATIFNEAMTSFSSFTAAAVARAYPFSRFRRVVDVGGGQGALLLGIAHAAPGLQGVLFDRPEVIAGAGAALSSRPDADRIALLGGDFLEAVPEGADAYLMQHIIHDWDDERAVRILRNCRDAVAPGGKILVVEHVVGDGPESTFSKLLDLEMLAMTPGGRERTRVEFATLFDRAGLTLTSIVPTEALVSILEAVPAVETVH